MVIDWKFLSGHDHRWANGEICLSETRPVSDQKTKSDLSRFLMIAYIALFSAFLSWLTALTYGSIWVTSFL